MTVQRGVKAVSFVAKSGTGKTTLMEKVISELRTRGYKVGALKAVSHEFDIDRPGKDSFRLAAAGAEATMICSAEKLAFVQVQSEVPDVEKLLSQYFKDLDIVLVEGYKSGPLPKIEIYRQGYTDSLLCCDNENLSSYIAVASDCSLALPLPLLDLNNQSEVTDFLIARLLQEQS